VSALAEHARPLFSELAIQSTDHRSLRDIFVALVLSARQNASPAE
jgi:hypothetical protein